MSCEACPACACNQGVPWNDEGWKEVTLEDLAWQAVGHTFEILSVENNLDLILGRSHWCISCQPLNNTAPPHKDQPVSSRLLNPVCTEGYQWYINPAC